MSNTTFIRAAHKDTCKMVKIKVDGEEKWVDCTDAVKNYTKVNFKEGDSCNLIYEGEIVTKVEKVGGTTISSTPPTATTSTRSGYSGEFQKPKTPEEVATIKSQSVGHMTSRALIALQGHINPNNIENLTESIYKTFARLVG